MQRYNKLIVAIVGGTIQGLELYYDVLPQWAQAIVLVATAFGVYRAPNKD